MEHNVLPEAGGLNDQNPLDMEDIHTLKRLIGREQWEFNREKWGDGTGRRVKPDSTKDVFDTHAFQQIAGRNPFKR